MHDSSNKHLAIVAELSRRVQSIGQTSADLLALAQDLRARSEHLTQELHSFTTWAHHVGGFQDHHELRLHAIRSYLQLRRAGLSSADAIAESARLFGYTTRHMRRLAATAEVLDKKNPTGSLFEDSAPQTNSDRAIFHQNRRGQNVRKT